MYRSWFKLACQATSYREYDAEQFQKSTGLARKRTTGTVMPRENTIHQGLVVCTKEYGAFVQLGAWVVWGSAPPGFSLGRYGG